VDKLDAQITDSIYKEFEKFEELRQEYADRLIQHDADREELSNTVENYTELCERLAEAYQSLTGHNIRAVLEMTVYEKELLRKLK
jgi:hypothetical protein